ncbi:MAG: hypothetical protein DI551_06980 [Micavibrio aeruginosavorus]|uniref:RNase H type-1 domain-containing protein n=1 Tax=Micavibrio aeruginosavorus TaxID=349221 RepID=A0A2W5MZI9_9BACT|nr:MAG: hypothetical protein DI551_06980 [Micavibrio aeruginosavorus]
MSNSSKIFDAWTDGAYSPVHRVGGAGWLIRHNDEARQGQSSIKGFRHEELPHGSEIAETLAVRRALQNIPYGATVKLRTDSQTIIDWFNAGKITNERKSRIPRLRSIFLQARDEIRHMERVEFIKVGGNSNQELSHVHHLAREASAIARLRR